MPIPRRSVPGYPSIAGALLTVTMVVMGPPAVRAQQPPSPSQPAPCLGYVYNARAAPLVAGGVQTVAEVLPGTPAEAGGLRAGDVLLTVAGVPTNSGGPPPRLVPGDTIPLVVSRQGRNETLTMVVGQRVAVPAGDPVCRPVAQAPSER